MCYDPDVSSVVLDHHLRIADRIRKERGKAAAAQYLRKNNVKKSDIGWKHPKLIESMVDQTSK